MSRPTTSLSNGTARSNPPIANLAIAKNGPRLLVIWIFVENFVDKLVGRGRVSAVKSPLSKLKQSSGLVTSTLDKMLSPFRHEWLLAIDGHRPGCICRHKKNQAPRSTRYDPLSRLARLVNKS
jgi:hypothetical protein